MEGMDGVVGMDWTMSLKNNSTRTTRLSLALVSPSAPQIAEMKKEFTHSIYVFADFHIVL